jgi:hypothetical protein
MKMTAELLSQLLTENNAAEIAGVRGTCGLLVADANLSLNVARSALHQGVCNFVDQHRQVIDYVEVKQILILKSEGIYFAVNFVPNKWHSINLITLGANKIGGVPNMPAVTKHSVATNRGCKTPEELFLMDGVTLEYTFAMAKEEV